MLVRWGTFLVVLIMAAVALSCVQTPEWAASGEGDVASEELKYADAIPLQWGNLVSVTGPDDELRYKLWFQDQAGAVRLVCYDVRANQFRARVRLFKRR